MLPAQVSQWRPAIQWRLLALVLLALVLLALLALLALALLPLLFCARAGQPASAGVPLRSELLVLPTTQGIQSAVL